MPTVQGALYSAIAVFVLSRLYKYLNELKQVGSMPGMRALFAPISIPGGTLPTSRVNPGLGWQWEWRNKVYQHYGSETISVLSYLVGGPFIYTSSLEVARQVLSTKGPLEKSSHSTSGVVAYGTNLFTANGDEWRRHRRIMGPAFSHETYSLVWEETANIYREMCIAEGWDDKDKFTIPVTKILTTKVALIILSRCGFGNSLPWKQSHNSETMDFGEALELVCDSFLIRLMTPKWMYWLPIKILQNVETAYQTLEKHMRILIDSHREAKSDGEASDPGRRDVLSLLLGASEAEGKLAMTDQELMGNIFFLLFAGHETMAHLLNATIGFLGLYEHIQEEIYQEIISVAPGDTPLNYSDYSKLDKVLACFLEAGRLFPAGFVLMRDTTEDILLTTYDENGVSGHIPVRKGVCLAVDLVGIHYNPRHFPEPEEYRPSRWRGVPESDFAIFSIGPRACIGRKFATTEATCFLSHLIREWKIEIVLQPGETRQQWRDRVLRVKMTMTLGVGDVPVRLVRR